MRKRKHLIGIMIFDIYEVDNDNQAAKSKGDEVPLEDLLVVLDVFDDKRADLPLGAFRGESAPENNREFKGGCPC